jgi:hypothetical protein
LAALREKSESARCACDGLQRGNLREVAEGQTDVLILAVAVAVDMMR